MTALEPPDPDREQIARRHMKHRDWEIQDAWIAGARQVDLAAQYGLAQTAISAIVNRAKGQRREKIDSINRTGRPLTLSDFERANLRRQFHSGFYSSFRLAQMYNISVASVYNIVYDEENQ